MTAMPKQTTIDEAIKRRTNSDDWSTHDWAFLSAKAKGACFDCATRMGFAATDKPKTTPQICAKCVRRGVQPTQ
jgi:hypothetical protein